MAAGAVHKDFYQLMELLVKGSGGGVVTFATVVVSGARDGAGGPARVVPRLVSRSGS